MTAKIVLWRINLKTRKRLSPEGFERTSSLLNSRVANVGRKVVIEVVENEITTDDTDTVEAGGCKDALAWAYADRVLCYIRGLRKENERAYIVCWMLYRFAGDPPFSRLAWASAQYGRENKEFHSVWGWNMIEREREVVIELVVDDSVVEVVAVADTSRID